MYCPSNLAKRQSTPGDRRRIACIARGRNGDNEDVLGGDDMREKKEAQRQQAQRHRENSKQRSEDRIQRTSNRSPPSLREQVRPPSMRGNRAERGRLLRNDERARAVAEVDRRQRTEDTQRVNTSEVIAQVEWLQRFARNKLASTRWSMNRSTRESLTWSTRSKTHVTLECGN